MRALVMGRFQPFHLGHLDLIRHVLGNNDEIIVAITSSQFNYLPKDPFTAGERIKMIHDSLRSDGVDMGRCHIVHLENQPNIATWSGYLKAALPPFDRVYSGNEYVSMLLRDSGIDVIMPELYNRAEFSSTIIRDRIVRGADWQHLVPRAVSELISKIGGVDRIRTIMATDTDPTRH